jgi:hypothetical protein
LPYFLSSSHQQSFGEIGANPTFRTAMADYYSLVAKAVGALAPNSAEARREVYDRARAALLSEAHKLVPAWDRSEIMAEQLFLELAIGEVEAELQPLQCAPRGQDTPMVAPGDNVSVHLKLPADHNEERSRGSLGTTHPQNVRRPGSEAAACDQRPHSPTNEESGCVRHTWMTELLARASRRLDEDFQDFAPKRGSSRVVGRLSSCDSERSKLTEALALWSQGYAAYR